jgi:hypothetical protein
VLSGIKENAKPRPPAACANVMLRKISGKARGERYEWKASDPFLQKLPGLIKAEEAKSQAAKEKKAAKKS